MRTYLETKGLTSLQSPQQRQRKLVGFLSLEDKLTELLAKALAMGDLHCAELYRKRLETL